MAAPAASKPKRASDRAARTHGADTDSGQKAAADIADTQT